MFELPVMTKAYYSIKNGYHFRWDVEGLALYLHLFLTWALDESEWSASRSG